MSSGNCGGCQVNCHFTPEILKLIDEPNFAQVATTMQNGGPKIDTVWIGREDNTLLIATTRKSIKAQNMLRDGRAAIALTNALNAYEQVQIGGKLVGIRNDEDMEIVDAIAMKYIGKPFSQRHHKGRVALVIEPTSIRYHKVSLD